MTALEIAAVTEAQMTQIQQWILSHDTTVKYVAVVLTIMLVLNFLQVFGVVPL